MSSATLGASSILVGTTFLKAAPPTQGRQEMVGLWVCVGVGMVQWVMVGWGG